MDTKELLTQLLAEKIEAERTAFLADMHQQSPDYIILHAFEIVSMNDLYLVLNSKPFSNQELTELIGIETPMTELYQEWLKVDDSTIGVIENFVGDTLKKQLTETAKRQQENPSIPRYAKSYQQAREHGQLHLFTASLKRDEACLQFFNTYVYEAYENRNLEQFTRRWTKEFGLERCRFVLGSSIHHAPWDGRYSARAKSDVEKQDYSTMDAPSSSRYCTNVHPCIIDATYARLMDGRQKKQDKER